MPDDNNKPTPLIRKRRLLEEFVPIDDATLWNWIKVQKTFPEPIVLNPGSPREIVAWKLPEVLAWQASRPQRLAVSPRKTPYSTSNMGRPRKVKLTRPE